MDTQIGKVWKSATNLGCALVVLVLPFSQARGDAVSDWNAIAVRMAASSEPSRAARELATVHAAMFETMNFVEGRYVPRFLVKQPAPLAPSGEVEAIWAAHYVLAQLYPERKAALDAALERSLAAFPDLETSSSARIWGSHLGGNVYAVSTPDRGSNGARILTVAGNAKPSRRTSAEAPGAGVQTLNSIATRSIAGRTLQPIERARIYALVSLAASEVYSAAKAGYGTTVPCVSCAVGAAIQVILETEFGSANETTAARAYLMPVRNDADESRSGELRGDLDSAMAGEEMGTRIGLQTLTYYRRIR